MMVKITTRQTNLKPKLTPSQLTDHTTPDGFLKRPLSMKGQRCKHIVVKGRGEEEKEYGVRNSEEMSLFKERIGCEHVFLTLPLSKNVWKTFCLWCRPPAKGFWCSPANVIRITLKFLIVCSKKIRSWRKTKGNLGLCVWWGLVQILESRLLQHWILLCDPHCTR